MSHDDNVKPDPEHGDLFDAIHAHLEWDAWQRKHDGEEPAPEAKPAGPQGPELILGGDPNEIAGCIPQDAMFEEVDTEFMGSTDLRLIGEGLIHRHVFLAFLERFSVGYLWKRHGAEKSGMAVMGTLSKPSGPLRYFSSFDFIVTIAADHCRQHQITNKQLEALVFHELLHASVSETGSTRTRPHEVEMFHAEVAHYGLWRADLKRARETFSQARMEL